jgi:hypothetical protein
MDARLVENLNRWFAANAIRADLCRALAIVPLILIGVLVVLAWATPRSNAPKDRSELLLGVLAALAALLLNLALGHLYYRARPFLILDVHPLLPEAVDSSLFSDHIAVAGAAIAALLVARRTFGWIGLGLGGPSRARTDWGRRPIPERLPHRRGCRGRLLPRAVAASGPGLPGHRGRLSRYRCAGDQARTRLRPAAPPREGRIPLRRDRGKELTRRCRPSKSAGRAHDRGF